MSVLPTNERICHQSTTGDQSKANFISPVND